MHKWKFLVSQRQTKRAFFKLIGASVDADKKQAFAMREGLFGIGLLLLFPKYVVSDLIQIDKHTHYTAFERLFFASI
jgi:hypothetical protein